jgi:hypothetical protein
MFFKIISELKWKDILSVVQNRTPEDKSTEFKSALSAPNGREQLWATKRQIGDDAKADIVKEIVAFANSEGGTLILGIKEDRSGRAESIQPIPHCRSLAEQLARCIVSSTEPKLSGLECDGVENEDESGVVVIRIKSSPRAPHRDCFTRNCYRRIGKNSEPMDMASIQAASVESWKGLEQVAERLKSRSLEFDKLYHKDFRSPDGNISRALWRAGCRATAYPLERLRIRDISRNSLYRFRDAPLQLLSALEQYWHSPLSLEWKPVLRGIRARNEDHDWGGLEEFAIFTDGLMEIKAVTSERFDPEYGETSRHIPADYFLKAFSRLFVIVDSFRNVLGRPDLEFAISLTWKISPSIDVYTESPRSRNPMRCAEYENVLDDLEFPISGNLEEFWRDVQNEFFHSFGRENEPGFPVDFRSAIEFVTNAALEKRI